MNKTELIAALAAKNDMKKADAEKALEALKEIIMDTMANGEKIQIVGFGAFEVKARESRVARNPRTGEEITIAASKVPCFKPGKELKAVVNK